MVKESRIIFKQTFSNKKPKYTYVEGFNDIVFDDEYEDLQAKINSFRHTSLEETLKRFLGDDYSKLYGEQKFIIDEKKVNDATKTVDKLEFYTEMSNFRNDLVKKYKLDPRMNLIDVIDFCSENADKLAQYIKDSEVKKNDKV